MYATLKIELLHLKSDFATLKFSEGLAALVISNHHAGEKLKVSSMVSKSCQENTPECLGRIYCTEKCLCIVRSTQSTQHAKCSA